MKYKAEIFDKVQHLYQETGFNDHQLHSTIRFKGKVNVEILEKAVMMLLDTIPILSCAYRHDHGRDYWKKIKIVDKRDVLLIVHDQRTFDYYCTSKLNALNAPQINMCLYAAEHDTLGIIMNHMVSDAAGFKQCLYLLSQFYSNLMVSPHYRPNYKIYGDRSLKGIMKRIPLRRRLISLIFQNKESNRASRISFPLSDESDVFPFIITRELDTLKYRQIRAYCKANDVTVNDVFLAAYYRALIKKLQVETAFFELPIMVDMRRYLGHHEFNALSNFSSTVIMNIPVDRAEGFDETVAKINREMMHKKASDIGVNGLVKLQLIFKMLGDRQGFKTVKNHLNNPPICMTNVGAIDASKLIFKGVEIENAFVCGSIKYRPHFQVALSGFQETLTLSSNLYGSRTDYDRILNFLAVVEGELPIADAVACSAIGATAV
ncbi:hypothetical protein KHM83_05115 [Fusibacter paucivorans]|uniref:Condensation domain-containing protein n=1 Tax=Fusibacter paucivorans TaxID=76009 RepID=A0ABS5PLW7_9FIRM|nr:hypothetical protein [Fusibacter paucivorans]MBS7526046.1 hypothetical protein [Fusibacter paucivorans]